MVGGVIDPAGPGDIGPASRLERKLGVVIITRNEAKQIAGCIESVLAGIAVFPNTQVVVVDSDSSDDTTTIAARYPVTVYRYRGLRMSAAAGRRIGARQIAAPYIFFIDGDCRLAPGWLELAVAAMERAGTVGVVCGGRQNAYTTVGDLQLEQAGWDLGGTALYRNEALTRAGGFNPFIRGNEEQELLARLLVQGYRKLTLSELMAVHHTGLKESADGLWRRHQNGMLEGPGQVLRASLSTGTFLYHARLFNRYILTFCYLAIGLFCALAELWHPAYLLGWIAIGCAAAIVLSFRRRSFREAMYIIADWVFVAIDGIPAFLRKPRSPESFGYTLDCVPNATITPDAKVPVIESPRVACFDGVQLSFVSPEACLTPSFRAEWDALIAASGNVYGQYQSADWLAHLCASSKESLSDPLVARHPDGRLAGVVPVLLKQHDLSFEFREHVLWRSRLQAASILGGVPLLPPDVALHDRALAAIREAVPRASCIYFHSVPTNSFCWRYLQESPWIREQFRTYAADGVRSFHVVELPASFAAYIAKFKHKKRYNLSRQERLLREHAGGRLELRRIENVDQVRSFREAVVAVMQDSWQGRAAIPEAYTIVDDPGPFEDLARRGLLRSYVLECGGEARAFVLGYQHRDVFHYAEIAYSETVQRFSPGTTLLYMLIQDLLMYRTPRLLNFGIGDAPYKREFGNVHFEDASMLLLNRTFRAAAVRLAHSAFRELVQVVSRRLRDPRFRKIAGEGGALAAHLRRHVTPEVS